VLRDGRIVVALRIKQAETIAVKGLLKK
jgi:hypothetical protein